MSFKVSLLIPVLAAISLYIIFYLRSKSKVFSIISLNWCKTPKNKTRISSLLYLISLIILCSTILDFRGEPTFKDGEKSAAHTIILLDTSLSMLAEDVHPSRIKAAIIHLKHFIKKSKDHIFELHVFSDTHKRVLAFTEDKNLLLTRLEALNGIGAIGGGSDISVSLKAAMSSFKINNIHSGNILLVTDNDFNDLSGLSEIKKNSDFNFAILQSSKNGQGSKIPLRTRTGRFRYNKKSPSGQEVQSRPNPDFVKAMKSKFNNFVDLKVEGFDFHSRKILSFFDSSKTNQNETLQYLSKPVYAQNIILFFFLFFILFYVFRMGKNFNAMGLYLVLFSTFSSNNIFSQEEADTFEYREKLRRGEITYEEVINFSHKEIKKEKYEISFKLLDEHVSQKVNKDNIEEHLTLGTLLLQQGKLKEGLRKYNSLKKYLNDNSSISSEEYLNTIRDNTIVALNQEKGGGKGKQKDNENSKDNNKDNENQEDSQGSSQNQNQQKQKKQEVNTAGIIEQILNDDKKSHEKYLKTELGKKGKGQKGQGNDW